MFVVVTELPDLPEPTVDLVLPELTVNPVLPELRAPLALRAPPELMALPVFKALMASQAQMELLVEPALPEQRVLKARPALRGLKALRVGPETANVFAQEPGGRSRKRKAYWGRCSPRSRRKGINSPAGREQTFRRKEDSQCCYCLSFCC